MQIENVSREQVVKNSFWKFLESISVQLIQLVITVILARMLDPDDYGLMALVLVSVNFLGLFVNSSISSYLIFIRDIKKEDFCTALISNIIIAIVLMVVLFIAAEEIASFYNAPLLSTLLRVMTIIIPLNSISSIYNAYAMKMSLFRTLFVRNLIALPASGIIALIAAFSGLGVWALVLQQVSYSLFLCVIVIITIKIRIEGNWRFEVSNVIPMFKYGIKVLLSSFIAFVSDNISDLLIGKRINAEQLGYYNRGNHFPSALISALNNTISSVLFPAFASYNSNLNELKSKYSKTIRTLYYITLPVMLGMVACAEPMVNVLLTDKWASCIPIIQIICIYYCALPFLQTSSQITLAVGKLNLRVLGEFIKFVVTIVALICFIDYGIIAVAFARLIVNIILVIVTLVINKMIIGYGFKDFLKDIWKPVMISMIMLLFIYPLVYVLMPDWIILVVQIVLGVTIYLSSIKLLHVDDVKEILTLVAGKIKAMK